MRLGPVAAVLMIGLGAAAVSPTAAYFHDVEVSNGNAMTAGVWDSSYVEVGCGNARVTGSPEEGSGSKVFKVYLNNTGEKDVRLDGLWVEWDPRSEGVERVKISGKDFWNGDESDASPAYLNGDYVLKSGTEEEVQIWFGSNVSGTEFELEFVFADGSTRTVEFVPSTPPHENEDAEVEGRAAKRTGGEDEQED